MGKFKEYFKEQQLKKLEEIKITELQSIQTNYGEIKWNENKSFEKFKSQIEDRIKSPHVTQEFLFKILQKGINLKFNDCYLGTTSQEDDTCLIFSKSQFIVIFNRKGKFIRSIRKTTDLDKIMCKTKKQVFECRYGSNNELTSFLEEHEIDLDSLDYGYKFETILVEEELMIEANKLCYKCIEIEL